MVDRLLYNTVLSQTFSPCGNYLLAGNTYGDVAVYEPQRWRQQEPPKRLYLFTGRHGFTPRSLQKILSPGDGLTPSCRKAEYHFCVKQDVQICSMVTAEKFLLIGMVGEITGWDWKTITTSKNPKLAFSIQIPTAKDALEKPDVNSMLYSKIGGCIYAGCGDNKIYIFSLEDGKLIRTMEGHDDYIHSIHNIGSQLVSASEDGSVRLWDMKQKSHTNTVQPYLNDKLVRPELGKWIGAAAISEDWLLCGGGPRLSLWHLRSLDVTTAFHLDDSGIHVAMFHDDRIMAGGASPYFFNLNYTGDTYAQIPSSSTSIYSAVYQETPVKVMCMAGSSCKIDLCTNFSYRDQILTFAP